MSKLMCNRGQGSLMLVLVISGVVGVLASSLMLNMLNMQRISISMKNRSNALKAIEDISQEVKLAYDLGLQVGVNPCPGGTTAVNYGAEKFCFQNLIAGVYHVYYRKFVIRRNADFTERVLGDKVSSNLHFSPPDIFEPNFWFDTFQILKKAQAFVPPTYLVGQVPAATRTMNTINSCTMGGNTKTPCIDCTAGTGNANCYRIEVCLNGDPLGICAAGPIARPIFGFLWR